MQNILPGYVAIGMMSEAAKETGYSYYHLTRIFQSLLGESIGNYIQKRDIADTIPNKHHSERTFGICEQLQETHTFNYDMNLSEVIGLEVTCYDNLPPGIVAKTIPAGKYAVFTHRGLISDIIKTYEYIWGTWVLLTKEVLDERDTFELYDKRFLGRDNEQSKMDIYIPIK